jgi:hypothetical protein
MAGRVAIHLVQERHQHTDTDRALGESPRYSIWTGESSGRLGASRGRFAGALREGASRGRFARALREGASRGRFARALREGGPCGAEWGGHPDKTERSEGMRRTRGLVPEAASDARRRVPEERTPRQTERSGGMHRTRGLVPEAASEARRRAPEERTPRQDRAKRGDAQDAGTRARGGKRSAPPSA